MEHVVLVNLMSLLEFYPCKSTRICHTNHLKRDKMGGWGWKNLCKHQDWPWQDKEGQFRGQEQMNAEALEWGGWHLTMPVPLPGNTSPTQTRVLLLLLEMEELPNRDGGLPPRCRDGFAFTVDLPPVLLPILCLSLPWRLQHILLYLYLEGCNRSAWEQAQRWHINRVNKQM